MSEKTLIKWADSTINAWEGCTKVSPGCANCYAAERDKRHMIEDVDHWGNGAPRRKSLSAVKQALAMNRKPWICDHCGSSSDTDTVASNVVSCLNRDCPANLHEHVHASFHCRRQFSLSLGDIWDEEVPIEWLAEWLDTIRQCDQVTWILCSKRWENFKSRTHGALKWMESNDCKWPINKCSNLPLRNWLADWQLLRKAPKNIIGLCSVENQEMALKRVPELIQTPLACRGLSLEPLLGPVDFILSKDSIPPISVLNTGSIDWLIIGGESGPSARLCNVEWIRSLVQQGQAAGVATFVKQLGSDARFDTTGEAVPLSGPLTGKANVLIKNSPMYLKDKKGGDPSEWPTDLRIQQWPKGF